MSNRGGKNTPRSNTKKKPPNLSANTQVIERHRRIVEHKAKITPLPLDEPSTLGHPKLSQNVVFCLRNHVITEFIDRAELGREEKEHLESGDYTREALVVAHAKTYARAIQWAVGKYADLLVQIIIGRSRQPGNSAKMSSLVWEETLRFADVLANQGTWESWLENCYFPRVQDGRSRNWEDSELKIFWERLKFHRDEWLFEVDRRIALRLVLAGVRQSVRRVEARRRGIAKLIVLNPRSSDLNLCIQIDSQNEAARTRGKGEPFPVPDFLKRLGCRLWQDAFDPQRRTETQRMHEYLSKIRKDFGLQDLQ
jgi:hypothetical protein